MVRRKRGKTAGSKGGSWEAVSRVVFPVEDGQQVMPLYAIDFTRPRINEAALATSGVLPKLDMDAMTRGKFQELVRTSGIGDYVCTGCTFFRSGAGQRDRPAVQVYRPRACLCGCRGDSC